VKRSSSQFGKAIAIMLCVLLMVFMTVEVVHRHTPSGKLQHDTCHWCATSHLATILVLTLSPGPSEVAGETIALLECNGESLLTIPPQRIRPPPFTSKYEDYGICH
jgi:hypothetical protein